MDFATRLKEARKSAGLTQEQLADKCGLATITIRQYELGKREPRQETITKIADAVDLPLSFFQATPPFNDLSFLDQFKAVILSSLAHNNLFSWNGRALNEIGNYEFWKSVADNIISITKDANDDLSIQYNSNNTECSIEKVVTIKGKINYDFNKVLKPLIERNCVSRAFHILYTLNLMTEDGHEKVLHYAQELAKHPDYGIPQE